MIVSDIIASVVDKVQDGGFSNAAILALINEGRHYIASKVLLPGLQTSDTVTTTSAKSSVSLPGDYQRNLFWVGSQAQGRRIGTREGDYYNLLTFQEVVPITAGAIEAVCVFGEDLLYRGMADDTLTLKYYRKPEDISSTSLEPTELPAHLQRSLLVAYCAREMYAEIEDGIEGQKVNTDYWSRRLSEAIADLQSFVAVNRPREPKQTRDVS